MTNYSKRLDAAMTTLRQAYTADQWKQLGGDEPAPLAGLRTGEVLTSWSDEQHWFDLLLYRGVWVIAIVGGVCVLGLLLLGWMP